MPNRGGKAPPYTICASRWKGFFTFNLSGGMISADIDALHLGLLDLTRATPRYSDSIM